MRQGGYYRTVKALSLALTLQVVTCALMLSNAVTVRGQTRPGEMKEPTTVPAKPKKTVAPPKRPSQPLRKNNTSVKTDSDSRNTSTALLAKPTPPAIEMVLIPAGSFMMGLSFESQHRVTMPSFYMGKYEVTQAQWEAVMGTNPSLYKGNTASFKAGDRPVESVSWYDAVEFCRKLSQMTGREYRLPTESEWEYAYRAGAKGDYLENTAAMGWVDNNSGNQTHAVGTKPPNAFGLYDMVGNVEEWCQDWYHETYNGAPDDGSPWESGGEQKERVVRGESYIGNSYFLSFSSRRKGAPDTHSQMRGFRVAAGARR